MKPRLSQEQNDAIVKALDTAIKQGPWNDSNFLKIIGKSLIACRERFLQRLGRRNISVRQEVSKAESHDTTTDKEVFVSLYSAHGNKLGSWERILANLPNQLTSRPIYQEELDVKNIIKNKENKFNEAYVAVYIKETDILNVALDKVSRDKLNKPLISLKSQALDLGKIRHFVHVSGHYHYTNGRLLKIED